jgi:lipopolysaccharide/colanic/teichoic acid biosynthesis glycosyltransferase/nucleoside-diphosphate-sugar epimerase
MTVSRHPPSNAHTTGKNPREIGKSMAKRLFDVLLAFTGLAVTWPLLLLIAVLIKLDSRGPVFFRQERVGKGGRPFLIFKFRTMVDGAYRLGPRLTQKRDPRVTGVGQLLRWLKLDELPQLLNVLKGEISFVGPRPEDPCFVGHYSDEERGVLSVRPGIVGPSQILGRDELEQYPEGVDVEQYYLQHILPGKLRTDLEYVRRASLSYDLKLLLHGVAVTIFGAIKPKFFRVNRHKVRFALVDAALSVAIYLLAFGLKFDWTISPQAVPYLALACLSIVLIRPPCFAYFGLYQNIIEYLGTTEFVSVVKAVTLGSVVITGNLLLFGFGSHSRAVLAIDWMLLIVVLYGYRLFLKVRAERQPRQRIPALIVGATNMGEELARELIRNPSLPYVPVAFLDDDPLRRGALIHGVSVKGGIQDLSHIARLVGARMVFVPYPLGPNGDLQDVVEGCRKERLDYRIIPTLDHLLNGATGLPETLGVDLENPHGAIGADGGGKDRTEEETRPRREPQPPLVLVTGGAGYVGSHLVRKLLQQNYRVRVLDNFLYGDHGLRGIAGHPRLEVVEGDVRHLETLTRATKGVSGVVALAALVGDLACELDPEETIATNYESTKLLADACRRQGVERLVFASSCSVYGANSDLALNEGSWLNPVSLYARTRIQAEEILLQHVDLFDIVILRLATVFGLSPRMRFDLLVNTITLHAVVNRKIAVFGGEQWRPNLHVQDAADAFMLALEAPREKAHKGIFNVGSNDSNYTVLQIAKLVKGHVPQAVLEIKPNLTDQRNYRVAFDKIHHVLGFRPLFTVEHGVREIAQALGNGLIPDPTAEIYHNSRYLEKHGFSPAADRPAALPARTGAA